MNAKLLTAIFLLLMSFSVQPQAQQKEDSATKEIFLSHSFIDLENSTFALPIIKATNFDMAFIATPSVSKLQITIPKMPAFKTFSISSSLPNPYLGSPAYEIINTYRNSLNIDVVTGKYYWEW
jgi:hypothetical protein